MQREPGLGWVIGCILLTLPVTVLIVWALEALGLLTTM